MPPRIEFALAGAVLAAVLAMAGAAIVDLREALELGVLVATMAAPAAFIAVWWSAGWDLFLRPGRRGWRVVGLSLAAVVLAMALFALCAGLVDVVKQAHDIDAVGVETVLGDAAQLAGFFAAFAVLLGGLPAVLLILPLSLRYLRRRELQQAAA